MDTCGEGNKVRVAVLTGDWRVEGDLHAGEGCRVTDALNAHAKEFIALTDVRVFVAATGDLIVETGFADLNRLGISLVWALE